MPALKKIQQSFRRSLKTYDENAFVQLEVAETLSKMLSEYCAQSTHFSQVLELGCGTGFLTKAILSRFTIQQLHSTDLVSECEVVLAEQLKPFLGEQLRSWEFVSADINQLNINKNHDLICSASSMQWVDDLSVVMAKIIAGLRSKGWLALSSFGPDHFSQLRELNQNFGNETSSLNYASDVQWRELLERDFEIKKIESQAMTIWFDSFHEMLQHLRNTGVNGNARQQWSQKNLSEFAYFYESTFAKQGCLPLSYEPIFIIAQKR